MASQRRYRRRTVRIETVYIIDGSAHRALATTLGAGGLFLQTATLPRNSALAVRFRLPGGMEEFEIPARVAWVHAPAPAGRPGVGLRFTDPDLIARLARALEQLPDASGPEDGGG